MEKEKNIIQEIYEDLMKMGDVATEPAPEPRQWFTCDNYRLQDYFRRKLINYALDEHDRLIEVKE